MVALVQRGGAMIDNFGVWIKEKRNANQYSQSRLSAVTGISKGYIGYIETTNTPPSRKMCEKLAAGLFLSETEVMTNAGYYPVGADIYLDETELDMVRKFRTLDPPTKTVVKGIIDRTYEEG